MIKKIYANNYKSLIDFSLILKPGVNALVGPNGSGKTNIISLFDFLSMLPNNELASAISASGGVGSIFRKIGPDKYSDSIIIAITGSAKITNKRFAFYKYNAEIKISEESETVFYAAQQVQVKIRTVDTQCESEINNTWDLDIRVSPGAKLESEITIKKRDKKKFPGRNHYSATTNTKSETYIKEILKNSCDLGDCLLTSLRFLSDHFWHILQDFQSAKHFNIIPTKAKQPEDVANEPYIRKDGSGLYSTLFAIKKAHQLKGKRHLPFIYYNRRSTYYNEKGVTIDKICEYAKLANKSVQKIDVENNPFDNQLQIKITINEGDRQCTLPLSAMSDGTVKWICFVTLLLSRRSLFAVEEPENYLHPLMQSELIRLMRNTQIEGGQILITTHSETILNALTPEEIIIVSLESGRTVANWPEAAADVTEEIKRTGFSLGYYYTSGALD